MTESKLPGTDPSARGEREDTQNAPPGVEVPKDPGPAPQKRSSSDADERPGKDREDEGMSPI
jgi:hypothetical protein